jgi:hypothetical protein
MFPFLPWYFLTLAKEDRSLRKNMPLPASHLRSPLLRSLLGRSSWSPYSWPPPTSHFPTLFFPLRLLSLLVLILFRVPSYPYRSTQVARRPSHWLRRCSYTSPASHGLSVRRGPSARNKKNASRLFNLRSSAARAVCCALSRVIIPGTNQPVMWLR